MIFVHLNGLKPWVTIKTIHQRYNYNPRWNNDCFKNQIQNDKNFDDTQGVRVREDETWWRWKMKPEYSKLALIHVREMQASI